MILYLLIDLTYFYTISAFSLLVEYILASFLVSAIIA